MLVEDVVRELLKLNQKAVFQVEYRGEGGCDTCGYGSEVTDDATQIYDLENKVVVSVL